MITKIEKKENRVFLEIPPAIVKLYDITPTEKISLRVNENTKSIVFCASLPKHA
ncbi:MAG: hypothetical protein R3327_04175 [Nitrosopumilaceae archaeon]|nr:hypothetical protein [Nitrosopumilaceae archaeon]